MEKKIYDLILPIAEDLKFEIVRLKLISSSGIVVQIMLERLDGSPLTISDCALFSRKISLLLEEKDPITSRYTLEVSSAGINRPLMKLEDFDKFKNTNVVVKLKAPIEIVKEQKLKIINGFLLGIKENKILIKIENDNILHIDYNNTSSARLDIKI